MQHVGDTAPAVFKNIGYRDSKSLKNGKGDGYTLCGDRTYSIDAEDILTVPT